MALVDININPLSGVLIKTEEEKRRLLENLRLARYGTDAERSQYTALWQQPGAGPYLLELVSQEYINAIWFLYHYYSNRVTGYEDFAIRYANIDQMHDRESGTLTISDLATAALELPTTSSAQSSSSANSSHNHSGRSSTTEVTTDQNTGETVIVNSSTNPGLTTTNNFGGNPYAVVTTHGGVTGYKATNQDPSAGSWSFTFNNGESFSTSDYNEALLVEAALWQAGKGPRPGQSSYVTASGSYSTYADAWQAYQNDLAATLQSLANGSAYSAYSTAQNANMNESALLSQMMAQQSADGTGVKTTPFAAASVKKSSNLKWWIIGGAAVLLLGGIIYRVSQNKKK
jgi:hypothetical protein